MSSRAFFWQSRQKLKLFFFLFPQQPPRQDLGPISRSHSSPSPYREISRLQEDRGASHQGNQSALPSPLPSQGSVS